MTVQEYIVHSAREAAKLAFRYAEATPPDRLSWSPVDGGRSVLSMCRELALTPTWTLMAFGQGDQQWSAELAAAQRREMEQWTTVAQCAEQFERRFAEVERFFLSLTDEDLKRTRWLPHNGGRDHTYLEMMDYPRWNCTYHLGQIAYIQTLYGDRDEH